MTENEQFDKLWSFVDRAHTISVFAHINVDGDSLGSALALCSALNSLGKECSVYCADEKLPERLCTLNGFSSVKNRPETTKPDLSIAVDCAASDRLGKLYRYYCSANETASIDHHKLRTNFSDYTYFEESAATAELIYKFLKRRVDVSKSEAECLFAGIVTDSGCFAYDGTTQQTHEIAKNLLAYGIDAPQIIYKTFRERRIGVFSLSNRILSTAKFYDDNKIAFIVFRDEDFRETDTLMSDTEGIIVNLINIDTVQVAFAMTETTKNQYKVSIRTKNSVDAADCAAVFGGGGHLRASGCRVCGFYEDVIDKLLKVARDRL